MLTKEKVNEQIQALPEKFSLEEMFEHFILMEKIDIGDRQSRNGETINDAEMDLEVSKWFE